MLEIGRGKAEGLANPRAALTEFYELLGRSDKVPLHIFQVGLGDEHVLGGGGDPLLLLPIFN